MSADKYEFLEWYKLDPLLRADLITVSEGVRRGAILDLWRHEGCRPTYAKEQRRTLEYSLRRFAISWREHRGLYYTSHETVLLERLWSRELSEGEFLGYPACCIDAFEKGCEKATAEGLEWGPAVQFWRKMRQCDNHLLMFAPHVPCDPLCVPTLALASSVKDVLEKNDPGAAKAVIMSNERAFYEFGFLYPPK